MVFLGSSPISTGDVDLTPHSFHELAGATCAKQGSRGSWDENLAAHEVPCVLVIDLSRLPWAN